GGKREGEGGRRGRGAARRRRDQGGRARRRGRDAGPSDAVRRGSRGRGGRAARDRDPARRAVPLDAARGRALDFRDRPGPDRSALVGFSEEVAMASANRRLVLKGAALGALAYTVGGAEVLLSPREAFAQDVPLKVLSADERAALEAFGETLLPGAKEAGLAHYVDQQLSVPASEALLVARAVGVMPPYANFYRAGLAGLDAASQKAHGAKFAALPQDKRNALVEEIRQKVPEG